MLRDAGVRTKLLAVLAIPTVLLVVVTALLVGGQVSEARRAGQVSVLADVAAKVNKVVHSLQGERSATLLQLQEPTAEHEARMLAGRSETDARLGELRDLMDASSLDRMPEAVRAALARSTAGHAELPGARASIDAERFYATETDVLYSRIIRVDLELPARVAVSGTPELAQTLQAYQALSSAIEYASHERDLVEVGLLSGSMNEAGFAQTAALVAQQRQALQDFQGSAPPAVFAQLDGALAEAANTEIDEVRRTLPGLLEGQLPDPAGSNAWVDDANSRVSVMTAAETGLVSEIGDVASATQLGQERRTLVLVSLAVLGLGLALMLAVGLARRITRPLRRLTVAAGEIGDELPHMVERMQTPGEGPGVVVEPIPVESSDEIGRLAEAFNTVNDVTVQVAKEQAALRASIAEMFVNVARRNQVLLGRQLKALDGMEAQEENPDVLQQLFTLDHLATRMRRNAESLLVLAGIDSTRRLRSALPLSDVIRTAVGEIEAYGRVDLSMAEDPDVSGRHALTVAHLLAELLENATHFSNPETRVVVSAAVTGRGVDVTVTDSGLGLSDEEVADANARIAAPPVAEIAVSQRLGLFVVGRLAARLGATVNLRRGRSSGTVVTASLPLGIFEGLVAPEPVAPVEAADFAAPVESLEPVELVELVESLDSDGNVEVADADADADAEVDAEVDAEPVPEQPSVPNAPRGRLWGRRRKQLRTAEITLLEDSVTAVDEQVDEQVDEDVVDAPAVEVVSEPVVEPVAEPAVAEPELEPVLSESEDPEPVSVPVDLVQDLFSGTDEPVSQSATAVAGAEPEPDPEPQRAPEPVVPVVYAPAIDVLPSRPAGGRFGRHRSPAPLPTRPEPAPPQHAPQHLAAPPLPPAPVPAPAPAPEPVAVVAPAPAPPLAPAALSPTPPTPTPTPPPMPSRPVPVQVPVQSGPVAPGSDPAAAALSELRGLYEPSFAPEPPAAVSATDAGLARRTARHSSTPAPAPAVPATPPMPPRDRSASEVRGMLSGFRAGVERGRAPAATLDAARDAAADDQTS